jgi:hypothetical protein
MNQLSVGMVDYARWRSDVTGECEPSNLFEAIRSDIQWHTPSEGRGKSQQVSASRPSGAVQSLGYRLSRTCHQISEVWP